MTQTKYITVRVEVDSRQTATQLFKDVAQLVSEALAGSDTPGRYTVHLGWAPSTVELLAPADR